VNRRWIDVATVRDIGERELIQRMLRHITGMPGTPIPLWDDASAIGLGDGRALVINTDMLVWSTDVPAGMTAFQAARKAVVMNVSDLGAKGVSPAAFMADIGLPSDTAVETAEEMARGFEAGSRLYGAYMLGGDTNESCEIVVSGIAFGVVVQRRIMRRAGGTRPGDLLATTGDFGLTSAGFKHLLEGYELPDEIRGTVLDSVYMPLARVWEGVALGMTGAVTGCMDSSDGLGVSLHDLRRSTGLGYTVREVPVHPAAARFANQHGLNPDELALYGGEEYELVFTFRPESLDAVKAALGGVGCTPRIIGEVTADADIVLSRGGEEKPIRPGGWIHFTGQASKL
jgi:thiamine-monophosphate kinase